MEDIVEYLSNPLKKGVWHSQIEIDLTEIDKVFSHIIDRFDTTESTKKIVMKTIEDVKKENKTIGLLNTLSVAILLLKNEEDFPIELRDLLNDEHVTFHYSIEGSYIVTSWINTMEDLDNNIVNMIEEYNIDIENDITKIVTNFFKDYDDSSIFNTQSFLEFSEIILFNEVKSEHSMTIIFDMVHIKEESINLVVNLIKTIPIIRDTLKILKKRVTYSTRYVFDPYPYALEFWLKDKSVLTIPTDLISFINGAIKYYNDKEWRTSIILSAISVEVILADIYEEENKDYAPDIPLGALYKEVKNVFPIDIQKAIEIINEARISAVHRSRYPVSDKEALNALYGVTTVSMWYSKSY